MRKAPSFSRMAGIITGIEILLLVTIYVIFAFSDRVPLPGLAAMGLLWVARWWATGRLTAATPIDMPILAILTMVPVSLYVSVDRSLSQPKFYGLILGVAVFYAVVSATRTVRRVQLAAVAVILISAAVVILGLVGTDWSRVKLFSLPQLYDRLPKLIQEIPRSRRGGFSPNGIGGTLTFLIPALLSLLWSGRPSPSIQGASDGRLLQIWWAWYRPILTLSLLLTAFTLALTQSRGSLIGIAIGLLALAVWHDRRVLWAIPLIALALFAVSTSGRGEQLPQFVLGTVQRRMEIWQRAICIIRDFPHAGVGMGAFDTEVNTYSFTKISDGWEYVERVVAPSKPFQAIDVYLLYDDQAGAAWFDDLTFQGPTQIASSASFELDSDGNGIPDHWRGINLTSQDGQDGSYAKEGSYSFKITGASGVKKRLRQRISLSGDASQQFLLSGWSRAEGPDPDGGYHGLMAVVRYSDGIRDGFRVPFSTSRLPTQVTHAHNELLQVAVDLGIPGLVGYVALLTTFAVTVWRAYHALDDRWLRALIVGLACGMLAHQVFGLTDAFLLGTKPGVVMWVFMGLIAALYVHRDSITRPLAGNGGAEAEGESGNGLESVGGSGKTKGGQLSRKLCSFLATFGCWALFSLLAIAFIGDQPYLGLTIALAGGVVLGFVCVMRFEPELQERNREAEPVMNEQPRSAECGGEVEGVSWWERANGLWQQANIRSLRVALGTGLSLVFLWLAFKDVPVAQVIAILTQADYRFVALALVLVLVSPLVRAARWRLLYHPDEDKLSYFGLAEVLLISQMLNIVVPARLGEVARIYFMGNMANRSRARTLGTIVVEKWLDILMLLLLLLLVPLFISPPPWFRDSRRSLAAFATVFLGAALMLSYGKDRLLTLVESLCHFLPGSWQARAQRAVGLALGSLDVLRSPWVGLQLQWWTLLIWLLSILVNYVLFLALGLPSPLAAALFLLAVLQVGVAMPSAPGKLGVFHYLCTLALAPFGVEKSAALSYAVLLYFVVFGPPLLLGAFSLWWESVRERRVETVALEGKPCAGDPH